MPHQRRAASPPHTHAAPKRQYKDIAGGDACVPGHTPARINKQLHGNYMLKDLRAK